MPCYFPETITSLDCQIAERSTGVSTPPSCIGVSRPKLSCICTPANSEPGLDWKSARHHDSCQRIPTYSPIFSAVHICPFDRICIYLKKLMRGLIPSIMKYVLVVSLNVPSVAFHDQRISDSPVCLLCSRSCCCTSVNSRLLYGTESMT